MQEHRLCKSQLDEALGARGSPGRAGFSKQCQRRCVSIRFGGGCFSFFGLFGLASENKRGKNPVGAVVALLFSDVKRCLVFSPLYNLFSRRLHWSPTACHKFIAT